jgi:hypothetical protein
VETATLQDPFPIVSGNDRLSQDVNQFVLVEAVGIRLHAAWKRTIHARWAGQVRAHAGVFPPDLDGLAGRANAVRIRI